MRSTLTKIVSLVEWQLELRFTLAERNEFEQLQIDKWNASREGRESLLDLERTYDQVMKFPAGPRSDARRRFREELLAGLRRQPDARFSKLLLGAYENAHGGSSYTSPGTRPAEARSAPAYPSEAARPADLIGTWHALIHLSSISYQNKVTGALAKPSGISTDFTFLPDGHYKEATLVQSSMYSCTTSVFTSEEGTYQVHGNTILVQTSGGRQLGQGNCSAGGNTDTRVDPRKISYTWRIVPDGSQRKLCVSKAGVDEEVCGYKKPAD